MEEEIVNKVASANIQQIDLADFLDKNVFVGIDLKELLWNELVLREKEFRAWVKEHDWSVYANKNVYLFCSNDAIIPAWAYMLLVANLQNATHVCCGTLKEAKAELFFNQLNNFSLADFTDQIVMVKGCSNVPNPNRAYVVLTSRLVPVVKNLMFGEPCSAVPVFKKKKVKA